jgi:hypothetical protein
MTLTQYHEYSYAETSLPATTRQHCAALLDASAVDEVLQCVPVRVRALRYSASVIDCTTAQRLLPLLALPFKEGVGEARRPAVCFVPSVDLFIACAPRAT